MTVGEWVTDGGWLVILGICISSAVMLTVAGKSFYDSL